MSLLSVLHQGSRALQVASAGVHVTSDNVANANTPGYARQTLGLRAAGTLRQGGLLLGQGVRATEVLTAYDRFSQGAVFSRLGGQGYAQERATALRGIESVVGTAADDGIGSAISSIFQAFSALQSDPQATSPRLAVLSRAEDLAERFHDVASELGRQQTQADDGIATAVAQANDLAGQIAALNADVVRLEAGGGQAGDVRAQRTALLEQLSALGPVTVSEQADGSATVLFAGHALVEGGNARALSAVVDATSGFREIHIALGTATLDISSQVDSGSLGAGLELRDTTIQGLLDDVDALAYEITTQVNTQHAAGFGRDGGTGRNLFSALPGPSGAALAMSLDSAMVGQPDFVAAASSAAALPGDNANAAALAGLAELPLMASATQTFASFWSSTLGNLGQISQSAFASESRADLLLQAAQDLRDQAQGVSLEEEAIDLIRFQQAYSAATKVVKAADDMLQELLNLVG
jgi:flagellar hook-associated protein 1 FlgK